MASIDAGGLETARCGTNACRSQAVGNYKGALPPYWADISGQFTTGEWTFIFIGHGTEWRSTGWACSIEPEVTLELYTHYRLSPVSSPCRVHWLINIVFVVNNPCYLFLFFQYWNRTVLCPQCSYLQGIRRLSVWYIGQTERHLHDGIGKELFLPSGKPYGQQTHLTAS